MQPTLKQINHAFNKLKYPTVFNEIQNYIKLIITYKDMEGSVIHNGTLVVFVNVERKILFSIVSGNTNDIDTLIKNGSLVAFYDTNIQKLLHESSYADTELFGLIKKVWEIAVEIAEKDVESQETDEHGIFNKTKPKEVFEKLVNGISSKSRRRTNFYPMKANANVAIVTTQAGFNKFVKQWCEHDKEYMEYLEGYPTQYPSLVVMSDGYRGYHYPRATCFSLDEIEDFICAFKNIHRIK